RLPWTLKDLIVGKKDLQPTKMGDQQELVALNGDEEQLLEDFKGLLFVTVDEKSGLVTIGAEMEEPLVSAQMANRAVALLQDYIIRYKTSQVNENLKFIQGQYQEKKAEFEHAQKALFEYRDAYRNLVAERMDTRYQELQDAYNLSMSVYQGLAQQLEQAKIAVKKETPVFSVIEPVKVPTEKSKPKRSMILVVSAFLGGFIGLGWIFGGLILGKVRKEWREE
ncbi:MAG: lipopolysaccharide biosynthesis protein, partial [Candidatus Atribacteria bacterium]|nr:lipopolysaccharide biosynthesis protein [Candidatus Atribacteria bacterium]